MNDFDWLVFDADGTLFDYDSAESQALSQSLRAFSIPDSHPSHQLYRSINAALWTLFEQKEISSTALRLRRFEQFLTALGSDVDPRTLSKYYLEELGRHAPLLEGARELIEELAPHYKLALATNGIADVQRRRIALSGLKPFFSALVISDEIGVAKPSSEYFEVLFRLIGHPKRERILIVGDSLTSDIKGGKEAGIFTCWFNPSKTLNTSEVCPDFEISDFNELHEILERPQSQLKTPS